jgi:hypothetical protein
MNLDPRKEVPIALERSAANIVAHGKLVAGGPHRTNVFGRHEAEP